MHISKRLQKIADMIPENSHVIDVGCDHGLLSIYLEQEKNCSCIASDINENALNSAKININKYHATNVETYLTDGIDNILIDDEDYIVIAGMGTSTIMHILENKKLSNNLVISSNNQLYELRKFVTRLGYTIVCESFVEDRHKKYVIIKFQKGRKKYSELDLEYGPFTKYNQDYLIYELSKLFEIKEKIKYSNFWIRFKHQRKINRLEKLIIKTKGK